jgi:hypothetical protein
MRRHDELTHPCLRFTIRRWMALVLLAALACVYEADRRYVARWQRAVMTVEVQLEVDRDNDGRADEVWTRYGDKHWDKLEIRWKQQPDGRWRRAGLGFPRI